MIGSTSIRTIRRPHGWRLRRLGTAVVEFAAILPVFVLLLLGTIETCNMIYLQQTLKIAAYEAARVSIVPSAESGDVEIAAKNLLASRRIKNSTVVVTPADIPNTPYGTFIQVDVSASCASNSVFALSFYGSKTLTGRVEMMKEF